MKSFDGLSVDFDRAIIGLIRPGDDFDEGGFAGSILPDQRVHFPGTQLE